MNGECNATNVQGKNYNLHKLQGGHVPQCPIAGDATALRRFESYRVFHFRVNLSEGLKVIVCSNFELMVGTGQTDMGSINQSEKYLTCPE